MTRKRKMRRSSSPRKKRAKWFRLAVAKKLYKDRKVREWLDATSLIVEAEWKKKMADTSLRTQMAVYGRFVEEIPK